MTAKTLGRFALLLGLEALAAALSIFAAPSEAGSALLLGLSAARLGLLLLLLLLAAAGGILYWLDHRENPVFSRFRAALQGWLDHPILYPALISILSLATVVSGYLILLAFKFTDAVIQARLLRLLPLLVWLLLTGLQTLILFPRWRGQFANMPNSRATSRPTLIALAGIALAAAFVGLSRLGLQPDRTGWDNPGTPLLGTQIALAFVGAILLVAAGAWLVRRFGWALTRIDQSAMILIWLAAALLWQAEPLTPTYFSPAPRAPNFEYYPYSDAAGHDLDGQNVLIGEGFDGVVEKPLYSFFLTTLHAIVGQDYDAVVNAQILLLALFPAVLYALGARLHSRLAGGLLAAAVILRERNAIALSGQIDVSHSKLLMTDLPAALALAALTLLLVTWLQSDDSRLRWPLWVGAALGLMLLLRSQTLIFLPLLLLLAFWSSGPTWRGRGLHVGVLLLGFLLAALPWLWRNYQVTGSFGYSQPFQMFYMATQYSLTPEDNDPGFPADARVEDYAELGSASVVAFTRQYPGEVARFITAHFLHNEVSSLLALPMRFDLANRIVDYRGLLPYWEDRQADLWGQCCSLDTYMKETPYWQKWDGIFPAEATLPLLFNLTLVALGLGAAWQRAGWLGLLPLGVHLGYSASTAIARVSGWRLILPADWAVILYYCLGLAQLAIWVWVYLGGARRLFAVPKDVRAARAERRTISLPVSAALILALALVIPVCEALIPARYQPLNDQQATLIWEQKTLADEADMADFLRQPGAGVLVGRALYPRYYPANAGEPGGQWPAFNPLPFNRLGFVLLGPKGNHVILPLDAAPAAFPNGADVLVFGCQTEAYFQAVAVLFTQDDSPALLSDAADAFRCP